MKVDYIVIHHSAVSRTKNPDQFAANNEYHRRQWNFRSSLGKYLGYHYEISPRGTIRQARTLNEPGAHTVGVNERSIGICLDGDFDHEDPTPEQTLQLKRLLLELKRIFPQAQIAYHRDFPRAHKTCPGERIPGDWALNLLREEDMLRVIGDNENKRQYILGKDGKRHWIYDERMLGSFHEGGVIDKLKVEWMSHAQAEAYPLGDTWGIILN